MTDVLRKTLYKNEDSEEVLWRKKTDYNETTRGSNTEIRNKL